MTTNLERRVYEHNHTKRAAKYTRSRRPVYLVWAEQTDTRSSALKKEREIKKLSKEKKEIVASTQTRIER